MFRSRTTLNSHFFMARFSFHFMAFFHFPVPFLWLAGLLEITPALVGTEGTCDKYLGLQIITQLFMFFVGFTTNRVQCSVKSGYYGILKQAVSIYWHLVLAFHKILFEDQLLLTYLTHSSLTGSSNYVEY